MRARGARLCALALAMAAVTACERDSYDKGTGDFVEAHTASGRQVTCAVTDGGRRLTLTPPLAPIWATVADTAYRAILYYNRAEGGMARPLSITPVAVLAPKPRAELKQVKTDPLTFESAWMSCGGKYLNVGLYLKTGEATGGDRPRHTLGAVSEGARQNADGPADPVSRPGRRARTLLQQALRQHPVRRHSVRLHRAHCQHLQGEDGQNGGREVDCTSNRKQANRNPTT